MGLPCISGLPNLVTTVPDGALALVDADTGTVTIRPREEQTLLFRKKVADKEHAQRLARQHALGPAVTQDDVAISVLANVGCGGLPPFVSPVSMRGFHILTCPPFLVQS